MAAWLESEIDDTEALPPAGDFTQALQLAFPGYPVVSSDGPAAPPTQAVALPAPGCDAMRYLREAGMDAAPMMPGPAEVACDAARVNFPLPSARPVALTTLLIALAAARQEARLLVSFRPIRLEAFALRQIAAVEERLDARLAGTLLPSLDRIGLVVARNRPRAWLDAPAGIAARERPPCTISDGRAAELSLSKERRSAGSPPAQLRRSPSASAARARAAVQEIILAGTSGISAPRPA
jgi:hypothetical protein